MCGKSKLAYKKTRKIRNLLFKKQTNKTKPTKQQQQNPQTNKQKPPPLLVLPVLMRYQL